MSFKTNAKPFCISAQVVCISVHNALNLCTHLCLYAQVHKLFAGLFALLKNTPLVQGYNMIIYVYSIIPKYLYSSYTLLHNRTEV